MDKRRSATGLQQRQAVNGQKKKLEKEGHHSASPKTTFETQSTSARSVAGSEVQNQARLPPLIERTTKSPVQRVASLFVTLFGKVSSTDLPSKWSATYKNVEKLTKILESNEKLPGVRVYGERVYDLVMETGDEQKPKLAEVYVPPFLKDAFGMVNAFSGGKNERILSPRVAPLMPERDHPKGFLSPSLFPFYKDDAEEQIMPVPKMLEEAGLNEKDREKVLEMVMEISGARETVDKALKVLNHLSSYGLGDKLFSASEKVADNFERLRASLKKGQTKQLDKRGFTFMEPSQLKKLHDDQDKTRLPIGDFSGNLARLLSRNYERAPGRCPYRDDPLPSPLHTACPSRGPRPRRYCGRKLARSGESMKSSSGWWKRRWRTDTTVVGDSGQETAARTAGLNETEIKSMVDDYSNLKEEDRENAL
ncbi:unnamed protein product [Heligmosomoides polygyrus]|uniref:BURP domain-containing protein n=1 Tax=Heligmosomoides polygyrus TaxID=6339 RepID=A0A3P8BU99_HELPZ|nr:unnamed protein product [Heligmosomoides polygyrus]